MHEFVVSMDYSQLGFKCGLEIHQQLEGKKLFCDCPTLNSNKEPDIRFERYLRAVAGETGDVDVAAKHEMEKFKKYIYLGNSEDVCLVEFDEEPPHAINKDALKTALQVALLLNAKIVDEIQVMRKTVVDGSNTSGFQRTSLIATDGYVETSKGKVRIPTICLEEEACQKIEETAKTTTYRLDRLGIPLIEIGTAADIKDPEHAKETAGKFGMILRSTGGVKRGLGTIRQDVNISIKGGARTEIKGFQDLRSIPKVVENEIKRQLDHIKKSKKLREEVRKAEPDFTTSFLRPMPGAARMYPETDVTPVTPDISGIKLPELVEDKIKRLEREYKITSDLAQQLYKAGKMELFESCVKRFKLNAAFIATTLVSTVKEVKRKFNVDTDKLTNQHFEEIFSNIDEGKISKDSISDILVDYANGKFDLKKYALVSANELEKEIQNIVKSNPNKPIGAYMGMIMAKYRGKVAGSKVMEILKKLV
jgi:Glu-tRNA(Gln) amidotransferase subunit E-like FAD-binding protein